MDDTEKIKKLIKSGCSCISIITYEEQYVLEVIRMAALDLKSDMWIWSVTDGVRDGIGLLDDSPMINNTESPEAGLGNLAGAKEGTICVTLDLCEYLKNAKNQRLLRNIINKFEKTNRTLVMIDNKDNLPAVLRSYVKPFEISFPDEQELREIITATLKKIHRKKPLDVGISKKGLNAIVRNLRGLTRRQAREIINDTVANDSKFNDEDINVIIAGKRRMVQQGGLLEYIETPLDLSEIGGMKHLKKWLKQRANSFTDEAEKFGLNAPRGVLMLGVQGAGKSLCAKAIATAWQQPLLKLDPGTLYGSYIGESEKNLRFAFQQTEMMSPVVLWIDEIEKAFASAASRSADGGLSQRMFGSLLTWLQERKEPVFVIATANDIEALPPELLRKGRFDEVFFVDLPDEETRGQIFKIHIRKRHRDPKIFDIKKLAMVSQGYSGAEIEQAVISALHQAYDEKSELDTEKIIHAVKVSPPLSVTMAEKVQQLRQWAKNRCVPAD